MMLAAVAAASVAMAQGNGQAGITEATQLVSGYFDPGTKLAYAVGAVIGLVGGIKVYQKFSSGDLENGKFVVRSLHLPDSRGYHPEVVLPLKTPATYG